MKKLIVLLVSFFIFDSVVLANTTDYFIEANIQENGNLEIKELKILDGEYNGAFSTLRYSNNNLSIFTGIKDDFEGSSIYNGTGIIDLKVKGISIDNIDFSIINNEGDKFNEVSNASIGDYGVYTKEFISGGIYVKMFMPDSYNKAFLTTYVIENAVVKHNDVAELAWDYIGNDYEEVIDNLKIVINLPKESNELRVFSHGPLDGYNEINSKSQVSAYYEDVPALQAIDVRVVFDKDLVNVIDNKKSNINGLDYILEVEAERANKAEEELARLDKIRSMCNIISVVGISISVAFGIYVYFKYDKEYKKSFDGKYYREFIEDYNVEVIDYLFNKNITSNAMSASIMNLIYKKNIKAEKILESKKENYRFTLLNRDNINESEGKLVDFLFDKVGDGKTFTCLELRDFAKSNSSYSDFYSYYEKWKRSVITEGEKNQFFINNTKIKIWGSLFSFGIIIINIFIIKGYSGIFLPYIAIICGFILLFYILLFKKRSVKGNDDYLKWKGFKNFLNDFGNFKEKDLPQIALWERYLVYAVIFNLANKVSKAMNVKIQEMGSYNQTYMTDYLFYSSLNRTLSDNVSHAVRENLNVKSSHEISSSGHGGGSSFGGGGFGGGGSGGGRF